MPYGDYFAIDQMEVKDICSIKNPCVLLTLTNDIQILSNIKLLENVQANEVLAIMPEFAVPAEEIRFTSLDADGDTVNISIDTDGNIKLLNDLHKGAIICCNGLNYNIASRYFNETIGNNFNNWGGEL